MKISLSRRHSLTQIKQTIRAVVRIDMELDLAVVVFANCPRRHRIFRRSAEIGAMATGDIETDQVSVSGIFVGCYPSRIRSPRRAAAS